MRLRFATSVALLAFLVLGARAARGTERPRLTAAPSAGPIHLDGVLNEAAWSAGDSVELTQASPRSGEPTPYVTIVRAVAAADRFWIGIDCRDPDPDSLSVHTRVRDRVMEGDDRISVVLDTFGAGPTGYLFEVNAAGNRRDALVSGPEKISAEWDGIWQAAVARGPSGWSVEIEIPARSLQFHRGLASWGMNVARWVPRDRLELLWSSPTLDSSVIDVSRAGELAGLAELEQGLGLSVVPYALARGVDDRASRTGEAELGGELYYNVTPQLLGVLTVNTDFAETEVDDLVANLTRFPLFLPEKRGFFLEGANLFDFGIGLEELFLPFYSRRIGLFQGEPVPILAGVKLLGRIDRAGVALLDTRTEAIAGVPETNLFAGRFTWDVDERLRVGLVATDGDPDGSSSNSLVGADAVWRTSRFRGDRNFAAGAWVAASQGDSSPSGQEYGYGFKIDYPNDLWDAYVSFTELGDALDPALGFLQRRGVRRYAGGASFQPRPRGVLAASVRQFFFELYPTLVTGLDDATESWRLFTAPVNVRLETGDRFEANWVPEYERLKEPFEVAEGVVIPAGEYRFTRYRLEAESSEHRSLAGGVTWWFGSFFDGDLDELEIYASWTSVGGALAVRAEGQRFVGDLPPGDFDLSLVTLRADFALPREATISTLLQYESGEESLGLNVRLRWTLRPGADLFVVWNRDWRGEPGETERRGLRPRSDGLTAKLRWTIRR